MKNEKMKEILDFFRNNKKKTCIGAGAGVAVIAVCVAVGITLGKDVYKRQILEGQLRDNKKAHILKPDGSYEKADGRGKEPYCAQEVFCKEAQEMSVKKEYRDTRVFIPETHVEME